MRRAGGGTKVFQIGIENEKAICDKGKEWGEGKRRILGISRRVLFPAYSSEDRFETALDPDFSQDFSGLNSRELCPTPGCSFNSFGEEIDLAPDFLQRIACWDFAGNRPLAYSPEDLPSFRRQFVYLLSKVFQFINDAPSVPPLRLAVDNRLSSLGDLIHLSDSILLFRG